MARHLERGAGHRRGQGVAARRRLDRRAGGGLCEGAPGDGNQAMIGKPRRCPRLSSPRRGASGEFCYPRSRTRRPAGRTVRVRNAFLSVDPGMRGWIADRGNYSAPVEIGSVLRSLAVGEVSASKVPGFRPGEIVTGWFGWQEFADVAPSSSVVRRVKETDLPYSLALGVLGKTASPRWSGLRRSASEDLAKPCSSRRRPARSDRQSGR